MTTAILKYKLPEEQEEFELAMKGSCYSALLWSLDQDFLRRNIKHGVGDDLLRKVLAEISEDCPAGEREKAIVEATLEAVRSHLFELAAQYEVSVY